MLRPWLNKQATPPSWSALLTSWADGDVAVRRAEATPDVRQDGEPVTRILLLLTDLEDDTWDVDHGRKLRAALGRKATELELPPVSLTLLAESDAEAAEAFGW
jgi:hypothetical protein